MSHFDRSSYYNIGRHSSIITRLHGDVSTQNDTITVAGFHN